MLVPKMLRLMVLESADLVQFLLPIRVLPEEVAREPPFQARYLMVSMFLMILHIFGIFREWLSIFDNNAILITFD